MAQAVDSLNSGLVRLGEGSNLLGTTHTQVDWRLLAKVLKRASCHISIDAAIVSFDSVFHLLRLQLSTATIATGELQTVNCELQTATLRTATLQATWATGQRGNYDSHPFKPKHAFQRYIASLADKGDIFKSLLYRAIQKSLVLIALAPLRNIMTNSGRLLLA